MERLEAWAIVNPAAGRGDALRAWRRLEREGLPVPELRSLFTEGPGHATRLARQAAEEGVERLLVVGGDGTVGEAVRGLVASGRAAGELPVLGILPAGTGNDFGLGLGLPTDPEAAVRLACEGEARAVDLIAVEIPGIGRHIGVNTFGAGFDGAIVRDVNTAWYKSFLGGFSYHTAVVKGFVTYRPVTAWLSVEGGEERRYERVWLCNCVNTERLAGGMKAAPGADAADGRLNLFLVHDLSRAGVLPLFARIVQGRHLGDPRTLVEPVASFRIRFEQEVTAQLDGELMGQVPAGTAIAVEVVPQAVRVAGYVPPGERDGGRER
ncbi:MAG: diacylglycerol kinase family lipid kinase [Bacillota bacterium]|nr:diacylglycerol kinase family lipid kinase [Bacillota bacterium]